MIAANSIRLSGLQPPPPLPHTLTLLHTPQTFSHTQTHSTTLHTLTHTTQSHTNYSSGFAQQELVVCGASQPCAP